MPEKANINVPQSVESEEALLGALLSDPDVVNNVIEIVSPGDFYSVNNASIYEACIDVVNEGASVDVYTVSNNLSQKGKLDKIGGYTYLMTLLDGAFLTSNAENYAKIIADKSTMRKLVNAGRRIATEAMSDSRPVDEVLGLAQREIIDVAQSNSKNSFSTIGEINTEVYLEAEANVGKGPINGVETGFVELDKCLAGLKPANLVIVGARPGMGKTAFMLEIAKYVSFKKRIPVAVFNLEMSKSELATRILSSHSMVEAGKIKRNELTTNDWRDLAHAVIDLADTPLYIDDTVDSSIQSIRAKCRRIKTEKNVGLIIIDYLQLMTSSKSETSRVEAVSDISRQLKMMARELGVPVIVASQLNRQLESRDDKRPQVSDLRESGSIEQDADIILMLYRDAKYNKETEYKNVAEVIVAKHRSGENKTIELIFDGEHMTFRNMAKSKQA